jgi:N-acetylglucosamine kinase-like BadF-type ATPase
MPVVLFTRAQFDAAARVLDALPDKPANEHRVTVREAVMSLQPQISGARHKGYTLDEIVLHLAGEGLSISASALC